MANRSSNSSIVDRLLAARASDSKSKPHPATSMSQDKPPGPYPSATMSANDRRELVQRMLQQRKQATFTETPSSPQIQSHRPHEPAYLSVFHQEVAAPAFSPAKPSAFRPGELISPASSPAGSTAGADPHSKHPQNLNMHNSSRGFQEATRPAHMPLQQHGFDQHRYPALDAEPSDGAPTLHACVSPPIHLNGGNRYLNAEESPASLGVAQLRPHPPQQAPSPHRPPSTHRRSRDSPSQYLPPSTSPGVGTVPDPRAFSQSYGPTAAEPLMMEASSMVLRGEPSDVLLEQPDARVAAYNHAYASAGADRGPGRSSAFANGPVLAPELSWQSTGASDSAPDPTDQQRASSAHPQAAQSRHESIGHESSTTQSLYFACDLLAEGSRMSHQHTAESSGSFHHDPLRRHLGSASHAVQDSQQHAGPQHAAQSQQSLVSSGMGGMPPMAYSTTSVPSIRSDVIERVAAVDPFSVAPMPTAKPSGAERSGAEPSTGASTHLATADWPAIPLEAWGASEAPARRVSQDGRDSGGAVGYTDHDGMHALQSGDAAAATGSVQLDAMYESLADSWQTQNIGALEKEEAAGDRGGPPVGAQGRVPPRGGEVDLTAPVGRLGGAIGQPRGRGRSRQEVLEEVMRERAAKGPQQRSHSARQGARQRAAGVTGAAARCAGGAAAAGGGGRIEQLARPRSIERYTARQKDAEEEQLKECTFAPQIRNRRSASARRAPHRRDLSVPAGERLHHAHDHVAKMRTRKQTEAMQQELSACTFAPQLHPAPDSLAKKPYVPLPERAAQLVKQKNAKLAQTRMTQELLDPQATFAPAINQRSVRLAALAAARRSKQPLHASMPGGVGAGGVCPSSHNSSGPNASDTAAHGNYGGNLNATWAHPAARKATQSIGHPGSARAGSMRASMGARATPGSQRGRSTSPARWKGLEPSDSKDCTFAPAVNEATDAYLHKAGIPATFEERQAYYERRRVEQAHVKQAALDPECTFHPQTAHPEEILAASSRRAHLDETQEEFWSRMTTEATRRECMLRAIDNVQQQQFTFAPSINPRSRRMARSKRVDELATDPQRHAFREAAAAAAEQRLAQECTFCPDTSKPGVPVGAGVEPKAPFTVSGQRSENIIERIHEYQDGRCRKLEAVRNRREWAELQECTFAPKTNSGKPRSRASSQAPVLVRGLDAHMSKLERAKKMAAEEAARRSKIFLEEPKAPRAKFTIAKPFNISDNNPGRELKKMQLQEERKAESMRECTFRPETNEGKKRQILEEILAAGPSMMF